MTRSPRVIITATDLVRAKPFAFTREQLNGICVDPKSVPVARAVFASAATPVYFAPLVMHNFAGSCGYQPPDTVSQLTRWRRGGRLPARARRAAAVLSRQQELPLPAPGRWRVRRQPRARAPFSTRWRSAKPSPTRCAATAFRARAACCSSWSTRAPASIAAMRRCPNPLGIKKVMDAVVSATFNRYSFETMNLLRARVKRWENEVRTTRCDVDRGDPRLRQVRHRPGRVVLRASQECRRARPTWTGSPPRSRYPPKRSPACAAPPTLLVEESPELRHFLEQSARSAQRGQQAGTVGNSRQPDKCFSRCVHGNACATLAPCSRSGESSLPSKTPPRAHCPRSTRPRRSPRGSRPSSRCSTTSRRRCTPRRCRAATWTSSPGSARCRRREREQLEKLAARVRKHGIDVDVAADWDFPPYEAIIRKAQRISPTC